MECASLWYKDLLSLALLLTIAAPGCSWLRPAEKTPPAAVIFRDDVPFVPTGPEDEVYAERRAIEEYKAAQAAAEAAQADHETAAEPGDE